MVQEYIHNVVDFMHIFLCLVNVFENIFYIFSIPLYGFHIMHIGVTIMMFSCGDEMQQMLCLVLARIIYITILENIRSNGNCELYIFEAFWPWPSYGYPILCGYLLLKSLRKVCTLEMV
jgi:hypothetical protein